MFVCFYSWNETFVTISNTIFFVSSIKPWLHCSCRVSWDSEHDFICKINRTMNVTGFEPTAGNIMWCIWRLYATLDEGVSPCFSRYVLWNKGASHAIQLLNFNKYIFSYDIICYYWFMHAGNWKLENVKINVQWIALILRTFYYYFIFGFILHVQ